MPSKNDAAQETASTPTTLRTLATGAAVMVATGFLISAGVAAYGYFFPAATVEEEQEPDDGEEE